MIRALKPEELDLVCQKVTAIDPWKRLNILPETMARNFRNDPLRQAMVYEVDGNVAGVVIYRARSFAPLVIHHGFGSALAVHHNLPSPVNEELIPDGGYVISLAVLPGFQGKGIGAALLDAAEEETLSAGLNRHYLMVSDFNSRAREFYGCRGYTCIGTVDDCLQPGNREHLMEKVRPS